MLYIDTVDRGTFLYTAGGVYETRLRLYELEGDYQVLPGHEGQSTLEQERKSNYCLRMAMGR